LPDRDSARLHAAAGWSIGLGQHQHDLEAGVHDRGQRDGGEFGRAGEDDAHAPILGAGMAPTAAASYDRPPDRHAHDDDVTKAAMTPLGGIDALFLHLETAATPMHVGALHLLEAPADGGDLFAAIRRHLASRLSALPVFTRRLRTLPLSTSPIRCGWMRSVDLSHHLKRVRLPAPGGQRELEATVARLHAQRLDRRRPLWQFFLIEGLADGGCALYSKLHHAAIDGAAGVALASALLDTDAFRFGGAPAIGSDGRAETGAGAGTAKLLAAMLAHNGRAGLGLLRQAPSLARAALGAARAGGGAVAASARHFSLPRHGVQPCHRRSPQHRHGDAAAGAAAGDRARRRK
jgi:hypothetical protein